MRIFRLPLCLILCLALVLPVFAQEQAEPRLYFVCKNAPTGTLLQTLQLAASEFEAEGFPYRLVYGESQMAQEGDFLISQNAALPAQGYRIEASGKLFYADEDGLLYGMRRMLKMLLSGGLQDVCEAPIVQQRVLMLDCARKYFSKNFICNLIAQMSHMGFNALELHLTEEQGIRADIWDEEFFVSENDYSWICGSESAYWVYDCPDPDEGKYLTAAELVEILQTAKEYHIEVIPSFNTPGHSEYLCNVYAEKAQNGDFSFVFDGQEYQTASIASSQYSVIDLENEAARAFVHSVLLDYAKFFAACGCKNFNICADEVTLDTSYDVFTAYINETAQRLQALGYRARAFNDFLCYDYASVALDENIDIVYWHTPYASEAADAQTFIDQGRTLYHAIQNYTYYALRVFNTPGYETQPSWGLDARDENNVWWSFNRATPDRIYAEYSPENLFETTDSIQTVLKTSQLGGSYFLIWCDYAGLADEQEIWSGEYPLLDRLWAHCAKTWNCEIPQTYEEFLQAVEPYYEFSGFVGVSEPINLPNSPRASYANCLTNVTDVERFRHAQITTSARTYWELLRSNLCPYGSFGRKRA
ncbi:MAG: hypothetical protein E7434_02690 [Ruminococcaceae bacterium]|nr:hypothetical protein [Oscillospiraceae bacterium]